jgi:hypothetical protein
MNNNIYDALRKLKVDCLYSKSNHFNASNRIKKNSVRFKWLLIAGTIFASFSTIMNVGIWDSIPNNPIWLEVIINVLGALGGFLILYSTAFTDYKSQIELANNHQQIASELNFVFKKIRNIEAKFLDGIFSVEQLSLELDKLTEEYTTKLINAPITEEDDYLKARDNFQKGFTSEYSESELNS